MNKKQRRIQKIRRMRSGAMSSGKDSWNEDDDAEGRAENANQREKNPELAEESFSESPESDNSDRGDLLRDSLFSFRNMKPDPHDKAYVKLYRRHLTDVEDDDMTEKYLCADMFTMMYLCKTTSHVMVFCLSVIAFQYTIIFLLILNATKQGSDNFFQVPVNVDRPVRACQFFAIMLMVVSQDDFVNTLAYFHDGYSQDILKKAPHATYVKFVVCGLLKLVEGSLCLFMTFILVVQSDKVLGLFLNFAALSFVFAIDDVFFSLAGEFFFSDELGILVNQIRTLKVPIPARVPSIENSISAYRYINITCVYLFAVTAWIVVSISQLEGRYVCQSISVQFGDRSLYFLGEFSGAYDRVKLLGQQKNNINNRFVYTRRHYENAMFAYCGEDQTWTFTAKVEDFSEIKNGKKHDASLRPGGYLDLDPCAVYEKFAMSQKNPTYNILDTANEWSIINSVTLEPSIDYFAMTCKACTDCNNNGNCIDDKCECFPGSFGLDCEFKGEVLCKQISESELKGLATPGLTKNFEIGIVESLNFISHDRPIFFRAFTNIFQNFTVLECIQFMGRRWAFYHLDLADHSNQTLNEKIIQIYEKGIGRSVGLQYFSEVVSFGSSSDTATPIALKWYGTQYVSNKYEPDEDYLVNLEFICTRCNYFTNPCYNGGNCSSGETTNFGECECPPKKFGKLCEAVRSTTE